VSLVLATDLVELIPPAGVDEHGWRLPGADPVWAGAGNFQPAPGPSDPRATAGGGHGPNDPAAVPTGTLYLPPESGAAEGWSALIRGRMWALSAVRLVVDPTGGALDCLAATATAARNG
jgi:hypothetical protein